MAETSIEVVLGMLFLTFSDANVQFEKKKLEWRSYTITEAVLTIKKMELINKKKFAVAALDKNTKTFVIYIATLLAAYNASPSLMSGRNWLIDY